jgi:hypothetical protein
MTTTYKIHPAIGVARVGNSSDYYLAPTTAGGLPTEPSSGQPVQNFRDSTHALRKQAARFQVYVYDDTTPNGRLLELGRDGVVDIEWTVHLANKKSAWYEFQQLQGTAGYDPNDPKKSPQRNSGTKGQDRNKLITDPGPRTVTCQSATTATFDSASAPAGYRTNFPPAFNPYSITSLGSLIGRQDGSVLVLGGSGNSGASVAYSISQAVLDTLAPTLPPPIHDEIAKLLGMGYASANEFQDALQDALGQFQYNAWKDPIFAAAAQPRIETYANNDFWFDDTSDGPVTATLIMSNEDRVPVDVPAWVLVGPPAYAPQIINMVSLYDTIYDTFVRNFGIRPDLFDNKAFQTSYKPVKPTEIDPILARPARYRWVANIKDVGTGTGVERHAALANSPTNPTLMRNIRPALPSPGQPGQPAKMPYLAGDDPINGEGNHYYLMLTQTQYFLLQQFSQYQFTTTAPPDTAGPGEKLDCAVLENCVGGAFCPGIEMTWISRNPSIYDPSLGFARIKHKSVGTSGLTWNTGDTGAYPDGLEPGDVTKYMAIPWQADFNECSNQPIDDSSVWWWPAQRPYAVYEPGKFGAQVFWTRLSEDPGDKNQEFPDDLFMVYNWKDLGFIVSNDGGQTFVEIQRQPLEVTSLNQVKPPEPSR